MKPYLRLLFFSISLILLDQIFKFSFSAVSICNKNIAWSISLDPTIFYPLWIIVCIFIIYLIAFGENSCQRIALVFILSGAISNMIDRLAHGCVIDFINLKYWPIFNLADIYITIGIIIILTILLKSECLQKS